MSFPSFDEFFADVHGFEPYPWQEELANQAALGEWPDIVAIPTGLGKTATIDVAVWNLARQIALGEPRSAPQRIYHVVERRLVVEQTDAHVQRIVNVVNGACRRSEQSPCAEVERALLGLVHPPSPSIGSSLVGDERGVHSAIVSDFVHGKHPGDRALLRASGCVIQTMTAHQFVYQLLFRGLGVGPRSRPVNAALVGIDRLVLFDEPHLALPAIYAIRDAERVQSKATRSLGVPLGQTVILGATVPPVLERTLPGFGTFKRHGLTEADLQNPRLAKRFRAERPLRLVNARTGSEKSQVEALAREAVEAATTRTDNPRIWVAVNTIATARAVAEAIQAGLTGASVPVVTLTSRVRKLDRPPMSPEGTLDVAKPSIVVATQCLEVGVDVSFDVVISEPCPYGPLVQRMGRLNRDGDASDPCGVLVAPSPRDDGTVPIHAGSKWVYGETTIAATLDLLHGSARDGVVDMSLAGPMHGLPDEAIVPTWPVPPRVATLHRGLVPLITTTLPPPPGDISPSAFVVGPDQSAHVPEVLVAWRANLEALSSCPPRPDEQVAVPLGALLGLVNGGKGRLADFGDAGPTPSEARRGALESESVRVQRGGTWVTPKRAEELHDGDQVVLHVGVGGYDKQGWSPGSSKAVDDLSYLVALSAREAGEPSAFALSPAFARDLRVTGDLSLVQLAQDLEDARKEMSLDELEPMVATGLGVDRVQLSDLGHSVLVSFPDQQRTSTRRPGGLRLDLDSHAAQVARLARAAAQGAGLSTELCDAVESAARWHDDGKRWAPYQSYFGNHAGFAVAKALPGSLAARGGDPRSVGVPRGWRHEALSAVLAAQAGRSELVIHLVAAHHGWHRPAMPASDGPCQSLGVGFAEGFDRLNNGFGPWGLAYLETVVRLADWEVSRDPDGLEATPDRTVIDSPPEIANVADPPSQQHLLPGLVVSPMTGWFALAGLLVGARGAGDHSARVCWTSPHRGGAPAMPSLTSRLSLEECVVGASRHPVWQTAAQLWDAHGLTMKVKYQKVAADKLRSLLGASDEANDWLTWGIVADSRPAEGSTPAKDDEPAHEGRVPLAIPAADLNSSYPGVALRRREDVNQIMAALVDAQAGWAVENCDGGMDRSSRTDSIVTGVGLHGSRQSRSALAPLALLGMAALGAPGPLGFAVTRGRPERLMLPLPTKPTGLEELRALTLLAGSDSPQRWDRTGAAWCLDLARVQIDKTTALWRGGVIHRTD